MAPNIVIVGDVLVDWFFWKKPSNQKIADQKNENINWRMFQNICIRSKLGGSWLVCELIKKNLNKTKNDLKGTQEKISEIKQKITKTKEDLITVQNNLNKLPEYLNTHPESFNRIREGLDDIEKFLSDIQDILNKTSEKPRKIQESLFNIEKILSNIQEILNKTSENSRMQESLNGVQEILSEVNKILNTTTESPREIQESLGGVQEILNTIPEDPRKIKESLNNIEKILLQVETILKTIPKNTKKIEEILINYIILIKDDVSNAQKNIDSENLVKIQEYLKKAIENLSEMRNNLDKIEENLKATLEILNNISIVSQYRKGLNKNNPDEILHLNTKLSLFPEWGSNSEPKVYRVEDNFGATIPNISYIAPISIEKDTDESVDYIIVYDAGNGFRSESSKWPKALTNGSRLNDKKPVVIYNMLPPLFTGELWTHTKKTMSENLFLILNVEDLRALGANISRSISWERTALELIWEINKNEKLEPIRSLKNVIIRFNIEGALHYTGTGENSRSKLYFDPCALEGGFWDYKRYGKMKGNSIVFISSLSSELIYNKYRYGEIDDETLERSIKVSIFKSREFQKMGHGNKDNGINFYAYFSDNSIQINNEAEDIKCTLLPQFYDKNVEPDPMFWSILKERTKTKKPNLVEVAMNIVHNGWSAIEDFPAGRFGKLITVDRAEIESFGSLKNIMQGYINSKANTDPEKNPRPLSISVFGYPGSGKSFGITEVAKSIDEKNIFPINFNVSQFRSVKDLISAFHRVRDISLKEKIPLVFFDEFDCTFENKPLGWLRYFLAPMQDGEFMDCGVVHPIGKSIFVFAGGVYKSFQEFCENTIVSDTQSSSPEKCPDFISRLRGNVNILGPNRISEDGIEIDKRDDSYIIRRAVQLRSLIEKNAPSILHEAKDSKGRDIMFAKIDDDLLKTLLIIPRYKHGVRSMEAIIDMSMLQRCSGWGKSSLPPKDQLDLHVDGRHFLTILEKPDIYCETTINYILNPNTQIMCNHKN